MMDVTGFGPTLGRIAALRGLDLHSQVTATGTPEEELLTVLDSAPPSPA